MPVKSATPTSSDAGRGEEDAATARLLAALAQEDADLIRRGRFMTCDFEVGIGRTPVHVAIAAGRVASVAKGPFLLKPWTFAVRAEPAIWLALWEPVPKAGFHDLLGLSKTGRLKIEGTLQPFMANLQFVKDLLALPRSMPGGVR